MKKNIIYLIITFLLVGAITLLFPSKYNSQLLLGALGEQAYHKTISFSRDTITTSGTADTTTQSIGTFNRPITYELQISADSLSGATNAVATLQWSACGSCTDWADLATVTINGVTTRNRTTGTIMGGKLQLVTIGNATAQSTTLKTDAVVAEKDN